MSNAAMKLNETSSDAYEKLEALLSPDVIKAEFTIQVQQKKKYSSTRI
ncbi:hypothetical protein [Salmonella enterica]|nr:hypothetical protein [Salmonella enterica]UQH93791.1 hypothetical protein INN81_24520 [Salmonella enterica]